MSSEQEQVRQLAERIARRLAEGGPGRQAAGATADDADDLAALRAGLAEIQQRLAHIESHIAHDDTCDAAPARPSSPSTRPAANPAATQRAGEGGERPDVTPVRSMWLSGTYVPATEHPSEERFGIGEAVSELVDYFEREKTCNLEPGGKPCDHCAMCSSRGF